MHKFLNKKTTIKKEKNVLITVNILNNFSVDNCGDHVVIINSKEIALCGDEWQKRVYFHHTTYHGGATWTLAWELHHKDPTLVTNLLMISKCITI